MPDDIVTSDGGEPHVTVIERRGSGGAIFIGLVLFLAVAIGAVYLITQNQRQTAKDDAIAGAAKSIERNADKVGDAVSNAVR
jgi:CHASE3 domain sensor protein